MLGFLNHVFIQSTAKVLQNRLQNIGYEDPEMLSLKPLNMDTLEGICEGFSFSDTFAITQFFKECGENKHNVQYKGYTDEGWIVDRAGIVGFIVHS